MSVLDKFLNLMRLSDDDEYYDDGDDFFDDEYEDAYDDRPAKKNFFGRSKREDYGGADDYDTRDRKPARRESTALSAKSGSKITPMRAPRKASVGMEVCVIKPASVEDAREISETLLSGRTVILNLEGLDLEIAQRIIDFTSGSTFAIDGNLQKISNYIFLVTPTNVDISGDLQNLLGSSIDASPIGGRY